jgi:SPP1 family predicted phage head-tail adaptor
MVVKREGAKSQSTNARNLITIRYRTMISDNQGGFTETWYDRCNVWAEICPMTSKQIFEYASVNVDATHRIKINGDLYFQSNTKRVADIWSISWTGIAGTDVQIHYQIDGGSWVEIIASTSNDGSYDWTIPIAAIGRRVIVRVMHLVDITDFVLSDAYNVVAQNAVDGLPNEYDQIIWSIGVPKQRTFEIKSVDNLQEMGVQAIITCKERRD